MMPEGNRFQLLEVDGAIELPGEQRELYGGGPLADVCEELGKAVDNRLDQISWMIAEWRQDRKLMLALLGLTEHEWGLHRTRLEIKGRRGVCDTRQRDTLLEEFTDRLDNVLNELDSTYEE